VGRKENLLRNKNTDDQDKKIKILNCPILEPNTNLLTLPSEFYQMNPDPAAGHNHDR
jgi:hypothetical protein